MGGMFGPIIQGQIDGHKNGLDSDLSMHLFIKNSKLDLKEFGEDYWGGFGSGYNEGQQLRNKLKKLNGTLSFEEYITCCQYLFLKTRLCRISPLPYLDKIDNWHKLEIDYVICKKALKHLSENKIQRALIEVFEFYKTDFRLNALKDFEIVLQDLKNLRARKKKERNFDISQEKIKIISDLKGWLLIHGQYKK